MKINKKNSFKVQNQGQQKLNRSCVNLKFQKMIKMFQMKKMKIKLKNSEKN